VPRHQREEGRPTLTRQDLIDLLYQAECEGVLDAETQLTLEGALRAADMQIRDIMVPRAEMVVLEADATLEEIVPLVVESSHSRFPVVDERHERVVGILLSKDLLYWLRPGATGRFSLRDILRPPFLVPESKRLSILLREFRTGRNHLAVVVDEYGSYAGLVTIEDCIEQIVGEIDDEHDVDEEDQIRAYPQHFVIKARTPIAAFNAYFHAHLADEGHATLGGLILSRIGRLPDPGEGAEIGGFCFEVVQVDARRIRTLRLPRTDQTDPLPPP
jgi:magnesium and cobalt transporter